MADWYGLDLLDEQGELRNIAVAHVDPAKVELARELRRRLPTRLEERGSVAEVVRTGRSQWLPDISDELLERTIADPTLRALARRLAPRSSITAPLSARGRVLGVLTLVTAESGRRYAEADVTFAEELAKRAALAIDNARLIATESAAARQAHRLQAIVDATFSASTLKDLLHELLARIVAELNTDLAGLLLMDPEEPVLRMRAKIGLEDAVADGVRVPLGKGFAGTVAATRKPLIVEDVSQFPVVSSYLRERVKSIVGVPLLIGDDVVGVMHTSSYAQRRFGQDDLALLALAAERAAVAIRRRELYEREHEIASVLQQTFLPTELPPIPGVEVATLFRAAGRGVEMGGDFYDAFPRTESSWGVVVGDVCGRGPRAAAVSGFVRNVTRVAAMRDAEPVLVLARVNDAMIRTGIDRFCTAAFATLDQGETGWRVSLARAGHPPPLVLRTDGTTEFLYPAGSLLGVLDDVALEGRTVDLGPGDVLVLYTDGLVERNPTIAREGLANILASCAGMTGQAIIDRLSKAVGPTLTGEYPDDVLVMVIQVQPT
jgi:serine phosphatase RsbU (regulator of sigma subunit)/putative methionine-R-sulfoxide reductase with GAF domain